MIIAETKVFTRRVTNLLSDEEYRMLQLELVNNPQLGVVIPGSGGLRKLRWGGRGTGKRGGFRAIYYYANEQGMILMLFLFGKNERDDLMSDQMKTLSDLVRQEFK